MNDKARELLKQACNYIDSLGGDSKSYRIELAQPEVKRDALSRDELQEGWQDYRKIRSDIYIEQRSFIAGVRFAEKHHGIGDNNENTNS